MDGLVGWVLAGIGCSISALLVSGAFIPRRIYNDIVRDRDEYREAAQTCAHAVAVAENQLAALREKMGLEG